MDSDMSSLPKLPSMLAQGSVEPLKFFMGNLRATKPPSINDSQPNIQRTYGTSSARYMKSAKASLASLWPTVAFLVCVSLLLFSLCGGVRRVYSGATVRKLADGGSGEGSGSGGNPFFVEGDWIALDADELASLCSALGEWAPSSAPQSASTPPLRMPEVASTSREHTGEHSLQTIRTPGDLSGASSSEQQHQAVGSTQRRRRLFPQGDSDGWEPSPKKSGWLTHDSSVVAGAEGPRSAVHPLPEAGQQTPGTPSVGLNRIGFPAVFVHQQGLAASTAYTKGSEQMQPVERPVLLRSTTISPDAPSATPVGSSLPAEVSGDSKQASVSHRVSVPATQSGSLASAGPSPKRSNEASLQLAAPQELSVSEVSNALGTKHPFVRTPTLLPCVAISDIEEDVPECWISGEPVVFLFRKARILSLKPALDLAEANELVRLAVSLAQRALSSMTTPMSDQRASVAAESLGRRFLVFDLFRKVLKLTQNAKPGLMRLWQNLVAEIPTDYERAGWGMYLDKHRFQHQLANQLSAALELYKSGSEPSETEVLDIKRKLFCMAFSPRQFLGDAWHPWREDDEQFK
ncbi:uncharacterized protein EMH_0038110 [Eimeria mitis]|uniref:Transmembrane protein n=1 Tax=Eimeria mitis TaxID=44415 RepID=U6JTK9_9EIME|nr:uncharacterized protein EMH_0038110 [Eimeria mitis]CDJ28121.1 hypothetical protein EMH_0038110 [Eimeria mitis]